MCEHDVGRAKAQSGLSVRKGPWQRHFHKPPSLKVRWDWVEALSAHRVPREQRQLWTPLYPDTDRAGEHAADAGPEESRCERP